MIPDDNSDEAYARECQVILNHTEQLSPEEIEEKFSEVGEKFFYNSEPKSMMLRAVYDGVNDDMLGPYLYENNQNEFLENIRKTITDYLSGDFYPSYFDLNGTYSGGPQGYSWNVQIKHGKFVIVCGNAEIASSLNKVAASIKITGDEKVDLSTFQKNLPEQVNSLVLSDSELDESLS